MASAHISFDGAGLNRRLLSRIERAKRSAVSTTTTWGRKQLVEKLQPLNPNFPKIVFSKFRTKKKLRGPRGNEQGLIWGGGRKVNAKWMAQNRPIIQRPDGVKAGKMFFIGAFKATMPSGHVGIFKRRGARRLPIDQQFVPIQGLQEQTRNLKPLLEAEVLRRFEAKLLASA